MTDYFKRKKIFCRAHPTVPEKYPCSECMFEYAKFLLEINFQDVSKISKTDLKEISLKEAVSERKQAEEK